jgi:F0F1-type ATP synthase assembly protein I
MGEEEKQPNNWAQAMAVLSEVSSWIVVPIVLALIFGKMLDAHFGTKPIIFLSLTGLAFIMTCYGMYKVVKNYINKLKDTDPASHKATQGEQK